MGARKLSNLRITGEHCITLTRLVPKLSKRVSRCLLRLSGQPKGVASRVDAFLLRETQLLLDPLYIFFCLLALRRLVASGRSRAVVEEATRAWFVRLVTREQLAAILIQILRSARVDIAYGARTIVSAFVTAGGRWGRSSLVRVAVAASDVGGRTAGCAIRWLR